MSTPLEVARTRSVPLPLTGSMVRLGSPLIPAMILAPGNGGLVFGPIKDIITFMRQIKQAGNGGPAVKTKISQEDREINLMVREIASIADVENMSKSLWMKQTFIPGLIRKALLGDKLGLETLLVSSRIGSDSMIQITSNEATDLISLAVDYLKEVKIKKAAEPKRASVVLAPAKRIIQSAMPVLKEEMTKRTIKKEVAVVLPAQAGMSHKGGVATLGDLDAKNVFQLAKEKIEKSSKNLPLAGLPAQAGKKSVFKPADREKLVAGLKKNREDYGIVQDYVIRAKQEKNEVLRKSLAKRLYGIQKEIERIKKELRG